jgi:hypothetical protein
MRRPMTVYAGHRHGDRPDRRPDVPAGHHESVADSNVTC